MEYVKAYEMESHGELGDFGIRIMLSVPRELTEEDKHVLWKAADMLHNEIMAESIKLDPETEKDKQLVRAGIVGLFQQPIYVEEIQNGYCHRWCCRQKPWYQVTTPVGRITIGWRKRVISIDWSDSVIKELATNLFPEEDVTRYERTIHAWGYDKAKQYIDKLMSLGRIPV